ncbi:Uncharacterized protein MSYG_3067 [Malassezia sympodialis ATCC 42132]|uniref:Complex 1 LYR protein domain-containing protein n=1 Tax=Malassezia sympodialis (strain ATCC 42132) TaxID=1230383 RepID=A0A1M8A8D6_MALS4|nr:Uncharacterized protein MSYG_3067 [Malassezia sympodialis ATCC 42132]
MRSLKLGQGPSFKFFLQKGKVLSLYRSLIRSTRGIANMEARWETIAWFRGEIEHVRTETDPNRIESHLTHGRITLKQMESSFSLSSAGQPLSPLRGLRSARA